MSIKNKKPSAKSFPEWWYKKVFANLADDVPYNNIVLWGGTHYYPYNWVLREKKFLKKLFILGYNPEGVIDLYKLVKPLIDKEVFPETSYCTMRDLYIYALEQRRK